MLVTSRYLVPTPNSNEYIDPTRYFEERAALHFLTQLGPLLAMIVLIGLAAGIGTQPMKKLIQMHEARHELKHGSAGFIRTMSGWFIIVLWLAATWFFASILGDWWAFGDIGAAIERSLLRLELLLHILAALADD